ncbi:hypothetical protein C900_04275 [Fulvivirga imtechensis AK7]|uniref:Uncharacterized protein n=1 Tax=Fulvivirga imtechensis AK7 TaxID=1237149 RepID=L8JZ21_9BACT|nr:hypothetical protein C900_04275 [Fulvivirga imtechensis AK7]
MAKKKILFFGFSLLLAEYHIGHLPTPKGSGTGPGTGG